MPPRPRQRTAPVLDVPPDEVRSELSRLRHALDASVPAKRLDQNLLIATWNIRAFEDLTEKWETGKGDSPKQTWPTCA
ncbi:hypothetical protein BH20ACT19_BH20ACT19_10110 [soil metagenome]